MPVPDRFSSPFSGEWELAEDMVFLNHGSFGASPRRVLEHRESLLREIEANPMEFLLQRHYPMMRKTIEVLEEFTGAVPGSIVMVENATTGVNTILRNLPLKPGDGVMVTDTEYFSSFNALKVLAREKNLRIVQVELPWPVSPEGVLEAFERAAQPGIRFALVDHVVSATGMILPLGRIVRLLRDKGIETVVDGAHGPGQLPLDLNETGCMAYTGNCHKWLCSPRSAALLYVRPDFQQGFMPLVVSHLPEEFREELDPFNLCFAWNGTPDPTPALSIPFTLDFIGGLHGGGWQGARERNRSMAIHAGRELSSLLGTERPCPDSMVGSMACVRIPGPVPENDGSFSWMDPLQAELRDRYGIIVPVTVIRNGEVRLLRVSVQLYNSSDQLDYLEWALEKTLVS